MLTGLFLLIACAVLLRYVKRDRREYGAFKTAATSEVRQVFLRRWLLKSFGLFFVFPLVALACIGQLSATIRFPPAFAPLGARIGNGLGLLIGHGEFLVGFAIAFPAGIVAAALLARKSRRKTAMVGDIAPLLPRNAAEAGWIALLSLNAGLSEELFFRLFLPLLLTMLIGLPLLGFATATILFGLVHLYQGWKGVTATMVVGALLAFVYLAVGNLLIVMALHALINLNSLVLQPWVQRRLARRAADAVG